MIEFGPVFAATSDLLRLLAVPVFAWAAWRDIQTRRVPNVIWPPLALLGLLLLVWDGWRAFGIGGYDWQFFLVTTSISVGLVVPLAYAFWRMGGFGGADAKALMTIAVLFPAFPSYYIGTSVYPPIQTDVGVFSFTILTNAVLVALAFPVALTLYNALQGQFASAMVVGRVRHWSDLSTVHGRMMEEPDGLTRDGLDLDALRMYLRWRGLTLAELRETPERYRDPETLSDEPNPPTDGAVTAGEALVPDGGEPTGSEREEPAYEDPWGAAAFLDDIEGTAYGTTPETLRDALDTLVERDEVWVSPGIPFIVPIFLGFVVALVYGDLLFRILGLLGLV
ncbi:A24 family peptidase C-terminal domain-containing protein [Natronoarchaeum sp. GCM10025703]|uniref:A24 family peptidase n=1 Tax=unclassified Natronoarchaeum TaxID=2620183 RepID=UPI0036114493